jgi:N-acetylneuraminic acid mutarotase
MKKIPVFLLLAFGVVLLLAAVNPKIPPMPVALSNNAVAEIKGGLELYSLMGIGPNRTWNDVTSKTYILHLASGKWSEGRDVPGVGGRLAAAAVGVRGQVYVFGGYLLDNRGAEIIVSDANAYLPDDRRWYRAEDMPVGVASAVIGADHDRYVYIVGGRSRNGPVNNVQVYDTLKNSWSEATPFPGAPVFAHAGGLADGAVVVIDGVEKNTGSGKPYVTSDECWLGRIDKKDPDKIEWSKLPPHPGPARFGIIAGAADRDHKIIFTGGTTAPHDLKGLDADGKPADFSPVTFAFDIKGNRWETISDSTPDPRTDSGGVLWTPVGSLVVGGMLGDQSITPHVDFVAKK